MDDKEILEKVEARKKELDRKLDEQKNPDKPKITSRFIQDCLNANELGDGMLYAAINKDKFLFDKSASEWLVWAGHHWQRDIMDLALVEVETGVNGTYLKEAAAVGVKIAEAMKAGEDDLVNNLQDQQKAYYKRVKRNRTTRGRKNGLEFAHTVKNGLAVEGSQFDQNPWLFACENGVIDLRTGELRPGKPDDLISKASPVEFTGIDTPVPRFENILIEVFEGKRRLIEYIGRFFGYGLTGLNMERILPVLTGRGWNGKSTIVELIMHVMGDHAAPIPSEMLLDQGRVKNSSGPSPDIMSLRGLRLVFASETDEGRRLSTSKVKLLTGADSLTGRNPHDKRPTTFLPTHKLVLITNNEPKAPPDDFALWERISLIPFNLSFVDRKPQAENERPRDKNLPQKLKEEASGVLAWLVRGCLEWQRIGLDPPEDIKKSTAKYRRSLDNLADFLDECCVTGGDDIHETAKNLYDKFAEWWEPNVSKKVPAQKTFGNWMSRRFDKDRSGPRGTYVYYGVGLLA